ncbi:MAG: tape measure protein, partial [Sulfurospirillaceae bacterium]|nr:tape measure protein [Sulfurospirillaceae bacterium]
MATQELKIKVSVDAQTGQIEVVGDEVDDLGKKAKDSSPKVNTLRQGVEDLANAGLALNFLKSAFGAVKEGVMALLDTAGEFEKYKTILTTLEGSSEKAETSFAWVKEFAAKTPYELNEVTKAFVKLKSYGIDPTDGTLKMLGDTSAAMGKDLNSAVEMMADALTGENERLKEFGIKASAQGDYIKYTWTNSSGEAKQAIVQNNSEVIKSTLGAIFNDKYQGSMDLLSNTWEGLTSNMADNWTQFKADLAVNSGLFDGAKEAVRTFNKEFSTITSNADYMDTLGTSIKWGAVSIIQAVQGVSQVFTGWAMVWKGLELGYEQLKLNVSIMTDQIGLKVIEAQAKMDSLNPFSSTTAQEWDVAIKTQQHKINQQIAATYALDEQYSSYVKNLDSSNKIFDDLQDSFLKNEKSKQAELNNTAQTSKKTSDTIIGKTEEQLEADKKVKAETKKLAEDYSKWVIDISDKTAKAQADEISKPYVELQLQYTKDLARYGSFVGAKEKLDVWYAAQLGDINEATAKKADEQSKKESEALEKKQKEEKTNLIASSKQRQDYYEKIEDYASAWAELERVLRLDDTKLTKDELDKKIAYEKKAYLESKGIYEDLYSAISSNLEKSTKDWENYNLIVGKGFASMVTNVQSTMQSSLVDMMEGKIKSINTFFTNLWGSVKTSFFNMVAEIATKKIIMSFMNSWASGGATGKGFVETFLGIDIPFLNFAEGTIWGSGKYGLAGGGYNSVDAYRNDTIPAMISKGEAVIPASAVNKNKSVVSALIAGSRLDNRGLLDVSYVQKIVSDLKSPSMFAGGYDPNELGFFDKASIDANGFYNLKGGGKGGIFGAVLGGIIGAFTGGLGTILISAVLGGAAGSSGLLDPIIEMVSGVFGTLMKVPWLGWVAQAA